MLKTFDIIFYVFEMFILCWRENNEEEFFL
ncbi:MAG: hypothetical protein BWY12_01745 [candidate division BRC1 bacterium ADurb.Bin183]|nr:MAG: hypothetical protein BWY12_01745 [candidate division BRC1 bacterium ADurb.Bin183]